MKKWFIVLLIAILVVIDVRTSIDASEMKTPQETKASSIVIEKVDIDASEMKTPQETKALSIVIEKVDVSSMETELKSVSGSQLCINDVCKFFADLGIVKDTPTLQQYLDKQLIVTSGTKFDPTDNQTTYFSGRNYDREGAPMKFMKENIQEGAIITVKDSGGKDYQYKVQKHVVSFLDNGHVGSFGPNNRTAIDLYLHGSDEESIAIQFSEGHNKRNVVWYATPLS